jgi:hypothetical protein
VSVRVNHAWVAEETAVLLPGTALLYSYEITETTVFPERDGKIANLFNSV